MTLESGTYPRTTASSDTAGGTLVVDKDARSSFEYILELLDSGVTFTYSAHHRGGLILDVERGRNDPELPARYTFPGLAYTHDGNVTAIAAQAIAAAIR